MLKTLGLLLECTASSYSSLLPRGDDNANGHQWINHDAVVPFTQNAADGAGLKTTGGGRSGCGAGGNGQVYARRGQSQGRNGIMYSYYTPKVRWADGKNNGHRHYWASVVVWVNRWGCEEEDITGIWPVGVSYTADHLNWGTPSTISEISFRGASVGLDMATHAKMKIHDNAISAFKGADDENIFERTLISWESLPTLAKDALTDVHSEDAAYQERFFAGIPEVANCDLVDDRPPKVDTPDDPPVTATTSATKTEPT
ncbi:NPP1 domain-containing protein [Colletotrichum salicis]|uniref:NPP1 domain-containing protein n=1 Tax=Colletotrichum salicis TaxID=1209931 RepID=A0A135V264_9PEZI|nr:NPP1 domain-containing protein [Colletotrichum salicis]